MVDCSDGVLDAGRSSGVAEPVTMRFNGRRNIQNSQRNKLGTAHILYNLKNLSLGPRAALCSSFPVNFQNLIFGGIPGRFCFCLEEEKAGGDSLFGCPDP